MNIGVSRQTLDDSTPSSLYLDGTVFVVTTASSLSQLYIFFWERRLIRKKIRENRIRTTPSIPTEPCTAQTVQTPGYGDTKYISAIMVSKISANV
ncbi:hypothetical protein ARMSODRAFT_454205 [Armillaria solidipes]|uniref:Uncharacterized protein n=1 Tax=Armillaria solidipes TaxID=1076256 RepID=A0A2H3BLW8_9AGAR|nr:hypothetical protein ARMSODRAFT_454205 [Armillaria solidipes]